MDNGAKSHFNVLVTCQNLSFDYALSILQMLLFVTKAIGKLQIHLCYENDVLSIFFAKNLKKLLKILKIFVHEPLEFSFLKLDISNFV